MITTGRRKIVLLDTDYSFEEFGFIPLINGNFPAMMDVERTLEEIPGRIGLWDFGTELKGRSFTIPLSIADKNAVNLDSKIQALANFLTDDYGYPRDIKMTFWRRPHLYITAKLSDKFTPNHENNNVADFVLEFTATDPWKHPLTANHDILWGSNTIKFSHPYHFSDGGYPNSIYIKSETIDYVRWGSYAIDFSFEYKMGMTTEVSNVEINPRTTLKSLVYGKAVQPTITITGSAKNLVIKNRGLTLTVGNLSNETIEIDCQKGKGIKNGVKVRLITRHFFLLPGLNELSFSGSALDFKVTETHLDNYL